MSRRTLARCSAGSVKIVYFFKGWIDCHSLGAAGSPRFEALLATPSKRRSVWRLASKISSLRYSHPSSFLCPLVPSALVLIALTPLHRHCAGTDGNTLGRLLRRSRSLSRSRFSSSFAPILYRPLSSSRSIPLGFALVGSLLAFAPRSPTSALAGRLWDRLGITFIVCRCLSSCVLNVHI